MFKETSLPTILARLGKSPRKQYINVISCLIPSSFPPNNSTRGKAATHKKNTGRIINPHHDVQFCIYIIKVERDYWLKHCWMSCWRIFIHKKMSSLQSEGLQHLAIIFALITNLQAGTFSVSQLLRHVASLTLNFCGLIWRPSPFSRGRR